MAMRVGNRDWVEPKRGVSWMGKMSPEGVSEFARQDNARYAVRLLLKYHGLLPFASPTCTCTCREKRWQLVLSGWGGECESKGELRMRLVAEKG